MTLTHFKDDERKANPRAAMVRVEIRDAQGYANQRRHDLRIGAQPAYVNPDPPEPNHVFIQPLTTQEIKTLSRERRAQRETVRAMKSNAGIAVVGIIGFGIEAQKMFEALDLVTQEQALRAAVERVATDLKTTVTGLVFHLDETARHAHFSLCGYDVTGQPLSTWMGRGVLRELQTALHEELQAFMPDLERGRSRKARAEAGAAPHELVNRSVDELHIDLPFEIAEKRKELVEIEEKIRTNEARASGNRNCVSCSRHSTGCQADLVQVVLDDMCRSGRIRGGFKVARPDLKPEFIDNFEIGGDYKPTSWAKITASAYYSMGKDFLYYVSTGDSIEMSFGSRPIMIRSNISNVRIYGFESNFTISPLHYLSFYGGYAYNISEIIDYNPEDAVSNVDLTGKYLSDVPKHSFSLGTLIKSKYVNIGITGRFTGKMFINDPNIYDDLVFSDQYDEVFTLDLKIHRQWINHINTSLSIQNLFDKEILVSKGTVGPGRFIVFDLGFKF